MHRIIITGAIVVATGLVAIGAGSAAHASVTMDDTGHGFVGKGDVQTALGYNNAQLQANAGTLTFSTSQDATQPVTQDVTQSATRIATQTAVQYGVEIGKQSATQEVVQTLSCIKTNGNAAQQVRTGTRDGARTAERIGTAMGTRTGSATGVATGTRTGTQTGELTGTLAASVAYEARKANQITGFELTGFAAGDPEFVAGGDPVYGDPTFGDYAFGAYSFGGYQFEAYDFQPYVWFGDFNFGATTWAEAFESDPNANPDLCVEGNKNIVPGSVKSVITDGAVTVGDDVTVLATLDGTTVDGAITAGEITDGDVAHGDVTFGDVLPSGAVTVAVNGIAV